MGCLAIAIAIGLRISRNPDLRRRLGPYLVLTFVLACAAGAILASLGSGDTASPSEIVLQHLLALFVLGAAAVVWSRVGTSAADSWIAVTGVRDSERLRQSQARTQVLETANERLVELMRARDEADAARALAEAQFRSSFEAAAVGKVQTDPVDAHIIRVNTAFADMLGYTPDELVGRWGWEFTAPEDREGDQAAYRDVLEGRAPSYVREKRYVTRSGDRIWARVSATIVRSPLTGDPILTVAVIENIDDRHKAKLALEEANSALEVLITERTEALAQRNLLLREVYHRVKNNLQVVDGLLLMQSRKLDDPTAIAALAALRKRVFALGLVHHQLMGSRDLRTFDVATFLNELSKHLQDGIGRDVTLEIDADPLAVDLDFAVPLGLLVTELATNAFKHAFPSGQGRVTVSLCQKNKEEVILRIADNGIGFAAAASGERRSLGLTIVEGLVRQMRGRITSTSDQGVCWEAHLPAPKAA